jgi:hypothetical protein
METVDFQRDKSSRALLRTDSNARKQHLERRMLLNRLIMLEQKVESILQTVEKIEKYSHYHEPL